ncbi:phage head-binding domain-containing protein [Salmonella enterica subsp. enterica serovar Johannesburg]
MSDITANVVVSMPSQLFTLASSFKAAANGKIYIGQIDTDPVNPANQIPVYLENEDGRHVQVAQPIVINAGGYPVYSGQIAKFVTVQGHSMAVYDAHGAQQFYFPNILKYDPDQFRLRMENVADIHELMSEPTGNHTLNVIGYVPGTNFGGGQFYWDASKPKSQHNGITVFSPTVPWDGSYSGLVAFLTGTGETNASGSGCWIRSTCSSDAIHTAWAGHDVTGANISNASVEKSIRLSSAMGVGCRISAGRLKVAFDNPIPYKDKYLVTRQTAIYLEGLDINIYADNDVEIDISSSTATERVVFGLKTCTGTVSGLNWNSDFTDYSTGPSDTTFKSAEDWMGFVLEGCHIAIKKQRVNASRIFINADALKGLANQYVSLTDSYFKYNLNYCIVTRNCDYSEFINNETWYSGRAWHTYGEDYAISEDSRRSYAHNNKFYNPISIQSRIPPAGKNITITDNYYEGSGIFVEVFAGDNVICTGNTSKITTDATGRNSAHYLLITNDPGGDWGVDTGLSNIVISNNIMIGGGVAIQGYNEGNQLKTGLIITNNILIDTKAPRLTASSWVSPVFSDNNCKFAVGFGDVGIGGQYPTVTNNILDGGYVSISPGYTVVSPVFEGNKFRNTVGAVLDAVFSMDNFTNGVFRNNDIEASSFSRIFLSPSSVTKVGFKFVDRGFSQSPSDFYAGKCVVRPADWVVNDGATTYGSPVAWVGSTSGVFLQINSAV